MHSQRQLSVVVHYFIYSLFLVLTISGTLFATYLINTEAKQEQQQKQQLQQDWLTTSIGEAVYRYDLPGIKALASQAMLNEWLTGITVSNPRDIPFIKQGLEQATLDTLIAKQRGYYETDTVTLRYNDEMVGFVHYTKSPLNSEINYALLLKTIALLVSLTFLLSLMARWFVETKITHQIDKLTRAVTNSSQQKLHDLSVQTNTPLEIAQLAQEFLLSNERLVLAAEEDFLTKLPNRRAFESKLHNLLSEQNMFVLGLIDIDNFKQVNDHFGHDVGDVLLVSCAQVLRETIKDNGFAARLGGDEFAFILECDTITTATVIADQIIDGVKKVSNDKSLIRINISASIGLAGPIDQGSPQDALRFADIALYKSKNAGRAQYTVYRPGFDEQPKRWIQIQSALNQALRTGYLNYELEPISYINNRTDYGVEMLLRLKDDEGNLIPPLELIEVAAQTGQLDALSRITLESGISVLKFHTEVSNVFLNFNGSELSKLDTPAFFEKMQQLGDSRQRLIFEITESTYLEDPKIVNILKKLRSIGIRIALDDFGTGYSSLACLNTLPLDFVKIDHSIVNKAFEDHRSRAVLRVILALRQEFHFEVITEGIESEQVLHFLQGEGVALGQGYLLNKKPRFLSGLKALQETKTAHVIA